MSTFDRFLKTREAAATAYTRGSGDEVAALSTVTEPATFFGPEGGVMRGAATIAGAYRASASKFGSRGMSELNVMQMAEGGDIAYWAGVQNATLEMNGKLVPMSLRVTELFRREGGEWKLVHRHADALRNG